MRPFYNHPVLSGLPQTLLGLVADLHRPSLYHVADVGLVLQHLGNALAAPKTGVGARIGNRQPLQGLLGMSMKSVISPISQISASSAAPS